MSTPFVSVNEAVDALRQGRMIILVDDESRENEGDLVIAAEFVTPEAINFMAKFGRGLICLPMARSYIEKLNLPMMARDNRSPFGTAFTVSIEAKEGVATGISASDRAHTISVAMADDATPDDLISPGHIFPLRAEDKGVLVRIGQTEGSIDLMKIAGLKPGAVICEIMNDDGSMSRRSDLEKFSKKHDIVMLSIQQIIDYRIQHERLVYDEASTRLPIKGYGDFTMTVFRNDLDTHEHFSLVKPPKDPMKIPLVRIHSECITGDVFGSCKCDCGEQLVRSLELISEEGGVLIYLRQEGRGIGLTDKLKAYALQEKGIDTVDANVHLGLPIDKREYGIACQILRHFGIETLRLLTNNPSKLNALEKYGIQVVERIPLLVPPTNENRDYLSAKKAKLGHFL